MYAPYAEDFKQSIWSVAFVFKFSPSEIFDLTIEDFCFWAEGAMTILDEGDDE